MLVIVMIQCTKRNIECISTGSKNIDNLLDGNGRDTSNHTVLLPVGSGKTVTVYVRVAKTKSRL